MNNILSEEYILANKDILNLNVIIIKNKYTEEFMEKIINYLDLKDLVRNNNLSNEFLEEHIYPYCDDHELMYSEILCYIKNYKRNK